MNRFFNFLSIMTLSLIIPLMALAQVSLPTDPSSQVDWMKLLGDALANPKALTAVMIGAILLLAIIQMLKSSIFSGLFKKIPAKAQFAIITILGQVYAIVIHALVIKDQSVSVAVIGLFTSGGAVAVFNAFKLMFEKPAA